MVVLPSTGASRYHNCCIDGGNSPEYFGYPLVFIKIKQSLYRPVTGPEGSRRMRLTDFETIGT
jgi:hypothetical protein